MQRWIGLLHYIGLYLLNNDITAVTRYLFRKLFLQITCGFYIRIPGQLLLLPVLQFYLRTFDARPLHRERSTHVGEPISLVPSLWLSQALHPLTSPVSLSLSLSHCLLTGTSCSSSSCSIVYSLTHSLALSLSLSHS